MLLSIFHFSMICKHTFDGEGAQQTLAETISSASLMWEQGEERATTTTKMVLK